MLNRLVQARARVLAHSGKLSRAVQFPRLWDRPWQRGTLDVARNTGIGDVIMCTPALREARRLNPRGQIRFYTDFPDLVRGLPYIDEVHPFASRPPGSIFVEYVKLVPSPVHIARLLGDRIGIDVTDTQPDCVVDCTLVDGFKASWSALPRPWVVALRRASRFTPNKDWPDASWEELVAQVAGFGTLIEIGTRDGAPAPPPAGSFLDLRGDTTILELVAAVAAADIYVGPVSGPMHIAAAVGTPSVVIIGGYEHTANAHYIGNVEFYTQVPCAPCWLREPCPFDIKCLRAIRVQAVADAVRAIWQDTQSAPAVS